MCIRDSKYARVLTELELNYRNRRHAARAMAYFGETFANGPELITAALAVLNFDLSLIHISYQLSMHFEH